MSVRTCACECVSALHVLSVHVCTYLRTATLHSGTPCHPSCRAGGERDRERALTDLEREKLEDLLRRLRVEREDLETAMLFVLDHADSAAEIAQCLTDSLTLSETPLHLKVARCARPWLYSAVHTAHPGLWSVYGLSWSLVCTF